MWTPPRCLKTNREGETLVPEPRHSSRKRPELHDGDACTKCGSVDTRFIPRVGPRGRICPPSWGLLLCLNCDTSFARAGIKIGPPCGDVCPRCRGIDTRRIRTRDRRVGVWCIPCSPSLPDMPRCFYAQGASGVVPEMLAVIKEAFDHVGMAYPIP